jgi:arylsulfatase A-like enzyme
MESAMTRRRALAMLGGAAAAARQSDGATRPNILFLFSDDQRFNTVNALGNPEVRTPNLDKLVARGTSFTRACIMGGTIGAVCAPSRAMLMTGQSLFHVDASIVSPARAPESAKKPFDLFPEVLRKSGYATFATGKWHNGPKLWARCFAAGDNIFFGGMSDHDKVPVHDFEPSGEYPQAKRHIAKQFSSELFSDSAIRFLKGHKAGSDPFCAYVAYTAPHDPRMAPKEYADLYNPAKLSLPKNFLPEHPFNNGEMKVRDEALAPWPRTPEIVRQHLAAYYAMITHLDAQIGRVLTALEESGHARNTIVVFASDNGLAVGQHGLLGKQNLYDHSVRVPLVIGGPGLPKGQRADTFCYLYDLFPTLCELTGTKAPATVEGRSLRPALQDSKARVRESVFFAYRHFQRAVRNDHWKLIRYNVESKRTTQLFDMQADPWETRNLADTNATPVREMNALLQDWMRRTDDPNATDFV